MSHCIGPTSTMDAALVNTSRSRIHVPYGCRRAYVTACAGGSNPIRIFDPSSGGIGIRLNTASMALICSITCRRCRSEEHTSELQSRSDLVCRLLLEKKNANAGVVPKSRCLFTKHRHFYHRTKR